MSIDRETIADAKLINRADGIFQICYAENKTYTLEENKRILARSIDLRGKEKSLVLLTGGDFTSHDAESRIYNSSLEVMDYCLAVALVSESLAGKLMANFFIKFNRPEAPTRFFNSEEEAIIWLLKQRSK